ncbi:MAG: hypothetical protein ABIR03_03290, partial [Ginsengibacter sp.]
ILNTSSNWLDASASLCADSIIAPESESLVLLVLFFLHEAKISSNAKIKAGGHFKNEGNRFIVININDKKFWNRTIDYSCIDGFNKELKKIISFAYEIDRYTYPFIR